MISQYHSNRKSYNWLAYDVGDRFLFAHRDLYRGDLYDLGAGESPYKEFFLKYSDNYISVDWANSLHDTSAVITADLNKPLPIENSVADTIVCLSVLEHLPEPQDFLQEAYRILKPGCAIILQVPWQWWVHEAPYDFYRYTPYGLRHLFEKAGFQDINVEPQAGFFTTVVLKLNYFSLRLIRGPRPLRWFLRIFFGILWYLGQKLAPHLDRLDKNWELEASGYFVTAKKL